MRLFRRRPKGRHALGAAVTGIPSAPVAPQPRVAPPPPWEAAAALPAPAVPAAPLLGTAVAPELVEEIAQLIATGEAWRDETTDPAPSGLPHPAAQVDSSRGVPAAPPDVPDVELLQSLPPAHGVLTASPDGPVAAVVDPAPSTHVEEPVGLPAQPSGGARDVLQAALADLSVLADPTAGSRGSVAAGHESALPSADVLASASPSGDGLARSQPHGRLASTPPHVGGLSSTPPHVGGLSSTPRDAGRAAPAAGPAQAPATATVAAAAPAAAGVPRQSAESARDALHTALADLSLLQMAEVAAGSLEVPAPRRVQLGFRDGTSTVLDPASAQARALEELAESLTKRD